MTQHLNALWVVVWGQSGAGRSGIHSSRNILSPAMSSYFHGRCQHHAGDWTNADQETTIVYQNFSALVVDMWKDFATNSTCSEATVTINDNDYRELVCDFVFQGSVVEPVSKIGFALGGTGSTSYSAADTMGTPACAQPYSLESQWMVALQLRLSVVHGLQIVFGEAAGIGDGSAEFGNGTTQDANAPPSFRVEGAMTFNRDAADACRYDGRMLAVGASLTPVAGDLTASIIGVASTTGWDFDVALSAALSARAHFGITGMVGAVPWWAL